MAAVLTKADTFAALDDCFTADLAALVCSDAPRAGLGAHPPARRPS
ncbi:hypothetical protein [Streptomyces sp. NPDC088141]